MDRRRYQEITETDIVLSLPSADAIGLIGELIDYSGDESLAEGCRKAIEFSGMLRQRAVAPEDRAVLNYFCANAWSHLRRLKPEHERWAWEQEELAREILHLREALVSEGFRLLPDSRKCEILVNLGNLMSEVGRSVDALPYWRKALGINPEFGMAVGNHGMGLFTYALHLHDRGHAALFLRRAYDELGRAATLPLFPSAREAFLRKQQEIRKGAAKGVLSFTADMDGFPLGSSPDEVRYREWCLENVLFVNPLNDLVQKPIAAADVLMAPPLAVSIDEGPYYQGFYDQMKQEYVSARFLFWEGINSDSVHFSDRGAKLSNTLDYPAYGLFTEKIRLSFRMAYSILDKIAFFLNRYLSLGCPESSVYFRSIWYTDQKRERGVHHTLSGRKNLPLRGLYWLSKDLFLDEPGFRDSIEPEGRDAHRIRVHLEHKYLKLHTEHWSGPTQGIGLDDPLSFSLHIRDFERRTLKLLQIARSALIYLSMSVHREETERAARRPGSVIVPEMELTDYEDDWKTHL